MTRAEMKEMFKGVAEHSRHLAEVTPLEPDKTHEAYCTVVQQARQVYVEILESAGRRLNEVRAQGRRVFREARKLIRETRPDCFFPGSFPLQEARAQFGRQVKQAHKEYDRVVKQLDEVYREVIAPVAQADAKARLKAGMITRDLYDHFWGPSASKAYDPARELTQDQARELAQDLARKLG